MNAAQKNKQLQSLIVQNLIPLIQGKVALFGMPNHGNIGDTYITLGELALIKEAQAKCIYSKLLVDSTPLPSLPKDCTILLQGGGDFGDVWRGIQKTKLGVIEKYKDNKIIILPQTVFYHSEEIMKSDAELMSHHPNLTLCARDSSSYEILKNNFSNHILLVPDLAFMINPTYLQGFKVKENREVLFLERTDKEAPSLSLSIPENAERSDWPTFQKSISYTDFNMNLVGYTDAFRLRGYNRISNLVRRCALFHVLHSVYPKLARCGVEFLCSYKQIYVTRLHAAILSTLLEKDVYLINNSYGKNIQFYSTWLHDADNVTLISNVS